MDVVLAHFTRADYERLPEGLSAQLLAGQLVCEPSPTYGHQRITGGLYALLLGLVDPARLPFSPVDVTIDDENVFQPDLVVLREVPADDARDVGIPWIAVEVLSPSTAGQDRVVKLPRLLAAGVAEVWLVDPVGRVVEVHDAHGFRSARGEERIESAVLPGFAVVPARLFEPPRRGAGT